MAFKMKGSPMQRNFPSAFKQIAKIPPPHNPRTHGVNPERVEKIDARRREKLKKTQGKKNYPEMQKPYSEKEGIPPQDFPKNILLDTVTVTPKNIKRVNDDVSIDLATGEVISKKQTAARKKRKRSDKFDFKTNPDGSISRL
tara:strand:- start:170 stop:595 length:426 start_codon:yes stop_codon:yes gene_type:complete